MAFHVTKINQVISFVTWYTHCSKNSIMLWNNSNITVFPLEQSDLAGIGCLSCKEILRHTFSARGATVSLCLSIDMVSEPFHDIPIGNGC